ncbi:sodium/solute symporter [Culex quinquefasciatus]|uniref:Sodium/solute symporter n=1 Tax=Culex quinquefasciatus TaxID=7176 RepID=B0W4K5_CULQU|nr:sodium/solute symporter [Culex quinquefasciatus]|eukprot:XP_001843639.1 sodium/solute symporter [Culex quinquefasciatus]
MESTTVAATTLLEQGAKLVLRFTAFDYGIFVLLLAISVLIGFYFGFVSKIKQNNVEEYLLGGKSMPKFPVAASLIATSVSGISLLGVPTDIYAYGTQIWMFVISGTMTGIVMHFIYLPVFHDMQLTSCFSYLELRFDRVVRLVASFVYALSALFLVPVVIYVPAMAFGQVSGVSLHWITPIFLNPDPTLRTSFWCVTLGMTTNWIAVFGINQACIQRFLAVPTRKAAKNSLKIYIVGLLIINSFACFIGLLMYARYEDCDPITTKQVQKLDQIVPFYVMDTAGRIPGLPGLFIAGVFAAALSTMSSSLNTLAGTIYEDFIRPCRPNASERSSSATMKLIVVILGLLVIGLVFIVEKLGSIVQMAVSCTGVISGSVMGMFTLGMVSTRANTKGVVSGVIVSISCMITLWISALGKLKYPFLPFRTDGCDQDILNAMANATLPAPTNSTINPETELPVIFRVSFMYYSLIGLVLFLVVAYPVSLMTGGGKVPDERLLTPWARRGPRGGERNSFQMKVKEVDECLPELIKHKITTPE